MSELTGQMNLTDLIPAEPVAAPEGYDADGNLLDVPANADADARAEALACEIVAIREQLQRQLLDGAIEIGRRLTEAKGLVPRGRWLEWLEKRVDYSERQAQQLMQIYGEYGRGELPESIRKLSVSQAAELLRLPAERREEVAESAGDLSVRELRAEVARLKSEAAEAQIRITGLEATNAHNKAALDSMTKSVSDANANAEAAAEKYKKQAAKAKDDAKKYKKQVTSERAIADDLRTRWKNADARVEAAEQRLSDAVQRANDSARELETLRARVAELEAMQPEPRSVPMVPIEISEELEALRAEKKDADNDAQLKAAIRQVGAAMNEADRLLNTIATEALRAKYAPILAKMGATLAEKYGGGSDE